MKRNRIEHVKKYSMLSLVEDLGFTLVYESSNYYHLEEHDSLKIRVNINSIQKDLEETRLHYARHWG